MLRGAHMQALTTVAQPCESENSCQEEQEVADTLPAVGVSPGPYGRVACRAPVHYAHLVVCKHGTGPLRGVSGDEALEGDAKASKYQAAASGRARRARESLLFASGCQHSLHAPVPKARILGVTMRPFGLIECLKRARFGLCGEEEDPCCGCESLYADATSAS